MATDEIKIEIAKLNKSQRTAMRRIVPSALSSLKVERIGWKTRVRCVSVGFCHRVDLGPRGAVLSKQLMEV